jgi:hypothetical protein
VAVAAGFMEEVVDLTVGKGTTMNPWSRKSQEVRSGEIHKNSFRSIVEADDNIE